MFASIRRYQVTPGATDELLRRVRDGFVPIISQAPGFVAYYALDAGNDVVASVSVFQDQAGADESNRMAASWVQHEIAGLMAGPPEITAGEVKANTAA